MPKRPRIRFRGQKEANQEVGNILGNVIKRRYYIVMGFVLVIAVIFAVRLFVLQISKKDFYNAKLEQYQTNTFQVDALRGEIVDRNYAKLAYNENVVCATYYSVNNMKDKEIDAIVKFLMSHVNVDISDVTKREKKDYLIMKDKDFAASLITDKERKALAKDENGDKKIYNLQIKRMTDDIVNQHLSDNDIKYYKLFYAIKRCTSGSTILLEGISVEEASVIGENSDLLRGVRVTSDWKRNYAFGTNFKQVLGNVTTKKQGLPATTKTELLALDYNNDSRVGTSGLETEYENILSGDSSTYQLSYNKDGSPIIKKKTAGSNGLNLQLTIDSELQEKVGQYIENELKSHAGERWNNHIYCILMRPKTGEVIAMAGKERQKDGQIIDYAAGNYLNAYAVGSSFKPATLYTCFKNHVINANHYEVDDSNGLKVKGTPTKYSHNKVGWGSINEVTALAYSSNVYMMKIIIKLGGGNYVYNGPLRLKKDAYKLLRNGAGELGLGVKSGIDIPNESLGYRGKGTTPGNILDFSIGQYDTYTNMQLATYTSTLANMGVKVRPHLLKSTYTVDSEGNNITQDKVKTTVIDDVSSEKTAFEQIKKGMQACTSWGTMKSVFAGLPYDMAGKSGTAQVFVSQTRSVPNHMIITYGPTSNPQIVCTVIVEQQDNNNSAPGLARFAVDEYFKKYGYGDSAKVD